MNKGLVKIHEGAIVVYIVEPKQNKGFSSLILNVVHLFCLEFI